PANRATSSGLPLGFFGNAASTASFSSTNARATASRRVFAFALTSTMCAWPASSKCESLSGIGLQAFAVLPSMLPQQHPHVLTRRKPFPPPRQHDKAIRPRIRRKITGSLPRHHTHAHLLPIAFDKSRQKPRDTRATLHILRQPPLDKPRRDLRLPAERPQHGRNKQPEANLCRYGIPGQP